ncbi:MAG: hypothetical protein M3R35_03785 [Candidatus Eremiobacteraeota bacterium]|nr:hypothetical protein [Candidatus Eremiobacteraeota bacterium]
MLRLRNRARRLLLWSLVLSLVLHFVLGPLFVALFFRHVAEFGGERIKVTERISLDHRPHTILRPKPKNTPQPQRHLIRTPRAIVVPHVSVQHAAPSKTSAAPNRKELIHFDRRAPARLTAREIAQQEAQFGKTIATARNGINPVAGATQGNIAPEPPAHFKRDLSGIPGVGSGDGYLDPVKHWTDGVYNYYYVRYRVTYADGSAETGIVPWPIRYLPANDPFLKGTRRIPLPGPLADYVLVPGTDLHPLVAYCYEHRLAYCPIDHP